MAIVESRLIEPDPSRRGRRGVGRWACLAVVVAGVWHSVAIAAPQGPKLLFQAASVRQEGSVEFAPPVFEGLDARSEFPPTRFALGQTDETGFLLYVDLESVQQLRFNTFSVEAFLRDVRGAEHKTYKYLVTGNATGSFRDSPARVTFRVQDPTATMSGSIKMPLYSATSADLLVVDEPKALDPISVSGATPVEVQLGNVAVDVLSLVITDVSATVGCPKCWVRIAAAVGPKNPTVIDAGHKVPLLVDFSANSLPALARGALILKPDLPHDVVTLAITYHTEPRGAERHQYVVRRVRFEPAVWALALAILGGLVLGLSARFLLTGRLGKTRETAPHAIASAIVFCLLAEIIGVLMTSYANSKVVLFDLDLDPRQVIPTLILSTLVSGGSSVVAWVKGFRQDGSGGTPDRALPDAKE